MEMRPQAARSYPPSDQIVSQKGESTTSPQTQWICLTENALAPDGFRYTRHRFVFNRHGDNASATGALVVNCNRGWKGSEEVLEAVVS
jgi:hypothetical protein